MSAFGGKADIGACLEDVRFGSKADIGFTLIDLNVASRLSP